MRSTFFVLVLCCAVCAPAVAQPAGNGAHQTPESVSHTIRLTVPQGRYAVLHFGQPVTTMTLPPDAPLLGRGFGKNNQPAFFMSNNTVVLLRFGATDEPVQAVVELADGTTRNLLMTVKPGVDPSIHVPGTNSIRPPEPALPPVAPSRHPAAGVVPVFSAILSGRLPPGWTVGEPATVATLHYNRLTATPIAVWQGKRGRQIIEYRLDAVDGKRSVLDPSQFYRNGVIAALLNGNIVDKNTSSILYLLVGERLHD